MQNAKANRFAPRLHRLENDKFIGGIQLAPLQYYCESIPVNVPKPCKIYFINMSFASLQTQK